MSQEIDPLNNLLAEMVRWLSKEAEEICKKHGLDKEKVLKLAEGKSFDEFSEAIDKMIAEKNNTAN